MIGRTLGHYRIVEKLGEGGMGVVYKARDTHLDRIVAVKILPPARVADPEHRARFVHEAKAASALNHPSIITVHDVSEADGVDFIVMEHVSGQTLSELITQNGLELRKALKYSVQIADALAKAHSAGIVHRDLKLTNIMVTHDGLVKVLDFGLAKLMQPEAKGEDETTCTMEPRTAAGKVIGTVGYMSPEQVERKQVNQRSDIFSFGAVLYEMVTGRRAFQGDSNLSTLAAVLRTEPAPLGPECAHGLALIIARCLRKDPERRWQSMADLKVALVEVSEQWESGFGVPSRNRRHRWLWPAMISAGAIIVSAGSILFGILSHRSNPPLVQVIPFSTYPGVQSDPVFSPDGNQVAFAWDGGADKNTDIYVKQIGEETPLRLTSDPAPDMSPDGRFIAFVRQFPNRSEIFCGARDRRTGARAGRNSRPDVRHRIPHAPS